MSRQWLIKLTISVFAAVLLGACGPMGNNHNPPQDNNAPINEEPAPADTPDHDGNMNDPNSVDRNAPDDEMDDSNNPDYNEKDKDINRDQDPNENSDSGRKH